MWGGGEGGEGGRRGGSAGLEETSLSEKNCTPKSIRVDPILEELLCPGKQAPAPLKTIKCQSSKSRLQQTTFKNTFSLFFG